MWKASETKNDKGSCIHSKDVSIQMSLFLYLLNMVTIIRISYPEKSNRVQSRSCHVSLLKLDIVFIKLKNNKFSISLLLSWHWWNWFEFLLETFVICFAKYHCILDLNATCLVCKAFLIHTFYENNPPCFSPINWVHKVAYLTMHYLVCFYLSLLWVTRLGTTPLPISWQKGGVGYGKKDVVRE